MIDWNGIIGSSGKTIYRISKESGVGISHIQRIISGEYSPRIETAEKLLDSLGYDLEAKNRDE